MARVRVRDEITEELESSGKGTKKMRIGIKSIEARSYNAERDLTSELRGQVARDRTRPMHQTCCGASRGGRVPQHITSQSNYQLMVPPHLMMPT